MFLKLFQKPSPWVLKSTYSVRNSYGAPKPNRSNLSLPISINYKCLKEDTIHSFQLFTLNLCLEIGKMNIKMKSKPKLHRVKEEDQQPTTIKQSQRRADKKQSKGITTSKMSKITVSEVTCMVPGSNNTIDPSLVQEQMFSETILKEKGPNTSLKFKIKINSPEYSRDQGQADSSPRKINVPFFPPADQQTAHLLNCLSSQQLQMRKEIKQEIRALNRNVAKALTEFRRFKSQRVIKALQEVEVYRERMKELSSQRLRVLKEHNLNLGSIL